MALVCDIKSDNPDTAAEPDNEANDAANEDLEDGEIEDDGEEEEPTAEVAPEVTVVENTNIPNTLEINTQTNRPPSPSNNKFNHINRTSRYDRGDRHIRYEDRKRGHLTEAEKSVMHLHKLERIEREKREKFKREQAAVEDDFASNIEKAIASILKKDKHKSEDDDEEGDKRGKKRKKRDKDKKKVKQRKTESPAPDEFETNDVVTNAKPADGLKVPSPNYSDSNDSNSSSDRKLDLLSKKRSHSKTRDRSRHTDKKHKPSGKNREQKTENQNKAADGGVCLFYLQGKCNKGDDCIFSHNIQVPMKLELCKFYVMECCAKGDNCSYMHSSFPCKFYHMGLPCRAGENCKFSHGKPLNDGLKQILFKHIETAPKEILGEFPRLNRDGALTMLNQAQKVLDVKYGGEKAEVPGVIPQLLEMNIPVPVELMPKDIDAKLKDKKERNRPSRWQDPDPSEQSSLEINFGLTGFYTERGDQDMRISSNGDIDMRTLPAQLTTLLQNVSANLLLSENQQAGDTDIRCLPSKDTDIRFDPPLHLLQSDDNDANAVESKLEIVTEEDVSADEYAKTDADFPANLPKKQRELFLRIQSHQKDTLPDNQKSSMSDEDKNIDWYSDDDDDGRLMIKDDIEEPVKKTEERVEVPQIPHDIKPVEVLEKLGDLSKIDISIEVTKLLSSLSQSGALAQQPKEIKVVLPEPVIQKSDVKPSKLSSQHIDPRKARRNSNENKKTEKISIYEQGSISLDNAKDVDLRNLDKDMDLRIGRDMEFSAIPGRPDVDLRHLGLPFKPMQNYTPATEIDASIHSHPHIPWRIQLVDIPQPDYTGLKLSAHDAKSVGDPRLRKIFRLSIEEKESPASPKETVPAVASPKAPSVRTDPRLRKVEEKAPVDNSTSQMNYAQQLTVLQASAFYQSLTSNQKLLLNQELADRVENNATNANDPILNGILSNLGLIPCSANTPLLVTNTSAAANTNALSILANVNSMLAQTQNQQFLNPIVSTLAQSVVQQTTNLGMANLPPDFQLNFDPRQGGLLGNAPPFGFNDSSSNYNNSGNYTDDYYEEPPIPNNNNSVRGRGGRGGFRDRQHQNRRGRNFNNRHNNGNRNFRNRNRNNINNNRNRTSP